MLEEAIDRGLDRYPDIATINSLPDNPDPLLAGAPKHLKELLTRCAVGATRFKDMPRAHLERAVRRDIEERLKRDQTYARYVREDVPGAHVTKYGDRWQTSSKGTFAKTAAYEYGGGLDALFNNGWMRIAKDRIDPEARSYQHDLPRKSDRQDWWLHFIITERDGKKRSPFVIPRAALAGRGATAIKRALCYYLGSLQKPASSGRP